MRRARAGQELLDACGRSHSLADVHAALDAVRAAAPGAWSLDLMAGLPRLGPDQWDASLAQAVAAQPDHISVYDLQAGPRPSPQAGHLWVLNGDYVIITCDLMMGLPRLCGPAVGRVSGAGCGRPV